jgi:hypothetical protein
MAWFVALGLVSGACLFLIAFMFRQVIFYWAISPDASDSEVFTLESYEPMARLLSEEDFVFLAAQPGYRPEMGAKLRRDRMRIFRLYLRELAQDFRRLHREARAMVAESQAEYADMVGLLLRQQFTFWLTMTAVELRLVAWPVKHSTVDVRGLLQSMEAMRLDLARFAAPQRLIA